jgi:hypothetical protein
MKDVTQFRGYRLLRIIRKPNIVKIRYSIQLLYLLFLWTVMGLSAVNITSYLSLITRKES